MVQIPSPSVSSHGAQPFRLGRKLKKGLAGGNPRPSSPPPLPIFSSRNGAIIRDKCGPYGAGLFGMSSQWDRSCTRHTSVSPCGNRAWRWCVAEMKTFGHEQEPTGGEPGEASACGEDGGSDEETLRQGSCRLRPPFYWPPLPRSAEQSHKTANGPRRRD